MSTKGVLAYLALGCSITALIAAVGDSRQIGGRGMFELLRRGDGDNRGGGDRK